MGVVLADSASAGKLVGNLDSASSHAVTIGNFTFGSVTGVGVGAQGFTTGSNPNGYVITGVDILVRDGSTSRTASVSIHHSTSSAVPGSKLYDLTGSVASAGVKRFTAPEKAVLNGSTTYFLRVAASGAGKGNFTVYITESDDEDSDSASGWSVADTRPSSSDGGSIWSASSLDRSIKLAVYGSPLINFEAEGKPEITGSPLVGNLLTARTSGISDGNGLSGARFRYQWVRVDGGVETDVSGATKSAYTLASDDVGRRLKVRVSFTDDYDFSERTVSNAVYVWPRPADTVEFVSNLNQRLPSSITGLSVSVPRGQRFTTGNATGSVYVIDKVVVDVVKPTVSGFPKAAIYTSVSNRPGVKLFDLTGTLSSTGKQAFTAPANAVLNPDTNYFFTIDEADAVGNLRVQTTPSNDEDSGVASGWSIAWFRVYLSSNVWFQSFSNSKLKMAVHGEVRPPNSAVSGKPEITGDVLDRVLVRDVLGVDTSGISDGNGLSNVSFVYQWLRVDNEGVETDVPGAVNSSYTVTSDDLDKSLKVRVSFVDDSGYYETVVSDVVHVSPVVLISNINQPLGAGGRQITNNNFVAQEFTTGNHSNGYSVSRVVVKIEEASSTRVPVVSIYSSDGTRPSTKLYEFNGSVTGTGDRNFTVPVGVSLSPDTSYFVHIAGGSGSGSFRIRPGTIDSDGFDSSSLAGWSISTSHVRSGDGGGTWMSRNSFHPRFSVLGLPRLSPLPDVNHPPVFSSSSTFTVQENNVSVGTVVADDGDSQDSVTGYSVSGGADAALFSITTAGVLTFNSAPNFESPSASGGDNEYVVEVTVNSGGSGRERFASRDFTVMVTDVLESPFAPGAPDLTPLNSTSLFVSWGKPGNTGPAIDDYDVEYRPDGGGSFVEWSHFGTSRTTIITSLSANTLYEVRVRASNDEGTSGWSHSSVVITDSADATPVSGSLLVGNINQSLGVGGRQITNNTFVAQEFTTGNHSNGYSVSRVVVKIEEASSTRVPVVSIYSSDGTRPGTKLYEFDGSVTGTGDRNFTVSRGVTLGPDTSYFVHIAGGSGSGFFRIRPGTSDSDGFDSSSLVGWSISTSHVRSGDGGGTWMSDSGFHPRFSVWGAQRSGSVPDVNRLPAFSSSSTFPVQENTVSVGTVTASDPDSEDGVTGYGVSGGVDSALFEITNGGVLTFRSAPDFESPSDSDTDNDYVVEVEATSGEGDRVRTATQAITVTVGNVNEAPEFPGNGFASTILNENRDGSSDPKYVGELTATDPENDDLNYSITSGDASKFRINESTGYVYYIGGGEDYEELSKVPPGPIYVLTINVSDGEYSDSYILRVSIGDVNDAPQFNQTSYTFSLSENRDGSTTPISLGFVNATDDDGDPLTYSITSGNADNKFNINSSTGEITYNGRGEDHENTSMYLLIPNVNDGTVSNGIWVTINILDVNEPPSTPSAPVLSSPSSTSLSVGWSAPSNTGPPIIDYDVEYRQGSSGSFSSRSHSGNGTSTTITGLSASTLYEVRVRAGNAEGTSGWSQTSSFTTGSSAPPPVTNNAPVFTSISSFSVNETSRSVGTVVASDGDSQDSVTGYSISGGVDSARFSITTGGVLTFDSAPNYESPSDDGGNNVYNLVVTARSGSGTRVRTAAQSIVVSVDDVAEAPSRPDAPTLSSPSSTSLSVAWSAPSNTGPVINDYDVEYRQGSSGSFSNRSHSGTSRTSTITGLSANTLYEVRVRASNAEGTSSWSQTSSFTTGSVATNNNPVFTSSSSFSVNENNGTVGTVVAEDGDSQDSVTNYGIWGGVDGSLFSITNGGVLTFDSVPDFESPVDYGGNNVYNFVVRASSGSGDRRKHAFQSITVTVDNVTAPSTPDSPSLSSSTSSSLSVTWSAPSNTGPVIDDYDVQYRQGSSGSFSNWSHSGNGTSTTIIGLSASTLYEVRVRAGNAEGTSSWSQVASFTTGSSTPPPGTNANPVFTSSSSFSVNENVRNVGTVTASDSDTQDSVTGYTISGGVDGSRFSITNAGVLTFDSVPNYESPVDVGGNNEYNLVVTAASGTGSRVRTATQSITVEVDDVAEAPSRPGAPTLSSPSSTSLRVTWSAPSNTGPPIIDYDVEYRQGSSGSFSSRSHFGTLRSATITGLSASTLYEVRVRAGNAEGTSSWSQTSSFTTGSSTPPPGTNANPVFTSSSSFSVNENSRSVGTVVASDSDSQDSVTGYSVSGGVDSSRFSITNAGVLTFDSVPNYESPADVGGNNEYNLVVRVTSGTGSRVRSATQVITVMVRDVAEGVAVVPSGDVVLVYSCG